MKSNFEVCSSIKNCSETRSKKIDILKDKKAKSKVCFTIKNDFSKFSTSSTNRANEFHKALRKKILNRKID
jgi:muramoyltetrapeptide carboxypeptidase LdcA involved in peptidoglycan recycling